MTREEAKERIMSRFKYWTLDDKDTEAIQTLIPELRESEDESIRRTLVEYFGPGAQLDFIRGVPIQKIRDWLEKQKEQKPAQTVDEDESIRKFLVDYFTSYKIGNVATKLNGVRIDDILNYLEKQKDLDKIIVVSPEVWDNAISDAYENGKKEGEKQKEQKPWKVGANAYFIPEQKPVDYEAELKKCKDNPLYFYDKYVTVKQKPAEWSEEDEEMLNSCISSIEESKENRYAYKENDGDTSYDHEIAWLKSLRPQQKVEWSEEDEKKITFLERLIRYNVPEGQYGWTDGHRGGFITKLEAIAILKSLRPSWKPSEAQLMALHSVIDDESDTIGNEQLKLLYNDLKKL